MSSEYHTPLGEEGMRALGYKGRVVCGATLAALMYHTTHAVPPSVKDYHVHEHFQISLAHENTFTANTVIQANLPVHVVGGDLLADPSIGNVVRF